MISVLFCNTGKSQARTGFEEFYYSGNPLASAMVTRAWYQSDEKWYGELRYNYEGSASYSLYGGRNFSKRGVLSYSFTPIGGLVMGKYKGLTTGINIDMKFRDLYFSSDSQYTFSAQDAGASFFFAWSELGCQVNNNLFAGLALQQTRPYRGEATWQPGLQMGVTFKNWSFPLYIFDPTGNGRSFVLGITWEQMLNSSSSTEKL